MADKLVKDYALDITRKLVDMGDGTHAEAFAPINAPAYASSQYPGSHNYVWLNGVLISDAWTVNGVTKTKIFTYTAGNLTSESDWL